MCDCAEELERRERGKREKSENAAVRHGPTEPSILSRFMSYLSSFKFGGGDPDEANKWKLIGGAALLLGLLGFLYKNFGDKLSDMKSYFKFPTFSIRSSRPARAPAPARSRSPTPSAKPSPSPCGKEPTKTKTKPEPPKPCHCD